MHKPYKKITAQLLLFSFLLESCYNPNIGIGKQALPTPDPADKQRQYAGEPHDKYPPKPPSHTWTTADKHPITFTYHNGQWQAAIKEHAAYGSWQRRQLPVVFEPGLTLEDVVDSNPIEQKQLLHLCPSEEEPDQPGYVYVGRAPSQAKPQPQLLSSPAARQTTPPSAVGLAQQQATAQPKQVGSSPQQAQEQPGRQAVLALPSPVQQIGEGPRSQGQLPTTPARVISKSLSTLGGETPRQRVAQKQPTSPQQTPSRKALSWRNQHELLHSQRAAQAKRAQSATMAKPGNELAQPAAPSQAIVSLTPAQPPSLADKAPPGIASQNLLAQGGHPVRFMHRDGQWWASVMERIGVFSRVAVLPVACEGHGDVAKALADLQDKPTQYTQRRIHVMHTKQIPYVPQFVYLGAQGLQGGGNGADEASGSGEPQDEPAAGGQAKHGPSKAVKIFKGESEEGVDLREYGSWYDDTTLEYLARTLQHSQHHPPTVIFHHHPQNKNMSFANQVTQLQLLKHSKSKKAALFLCHEPVVGHHYLFGILYEHRLILLNPVGASDHQDLYEALAAVKQQGIVEEVYLSRTRIQQEDQLVSCGPISAEWMLHYGAMDEEHLGKVVDELCSSGEKREKHVGQGQEATMLPYQEVEVSPWLPASLHGLVHANPASYKGELVKLRRNHLARLEPKRASELEEDRDEQVWFNQVVLERKNILTLEASEAPQGLVKRAEQRKLKPTSGQEWIQLASGHAVPRALERTESQGTTQLELAQVEAKRLKEQIAELYSRLPQATEEADSKVVHELTTCLARLLELEGFCAPAQGEDGAKEYIARLREDHRTKWDSTESGAAVSKKLTGLLEQAYSQELKRVAPARRVDKTSDGAARLAQVLGQLAVLDQEQGAATGDLTYYTDAAILYQNVLRVCAEEMQKLESQAAEARGYQAQIAAAYSGLAKIRGAILASGKGGKEGVVAQGGMRIAELQEEIAKDKQVLQALRKDADRKVEDLEAALSKQGSEEEVLAAEKEYIQGSRALFANIAKGVREFLGRLYQESEQALGPSPCKYTVMGLGSMALAQMTPYSDLEFAILMEEAQDAAAAEEYKAYLRQLTHLVHFRVINLGETTIPISKYKISLDHLTKRGLNFDLGGKTPLGRKDKFYDLIQPVAGMLRYLKNEGNKIEHIDKLLPFILESTCYVHGDEGLYQAYAGEKRTFLTEDPEGQTEQGLPTYQARALKKLLEGVVEMDYSKPGVAEARPKQGDLVDFKPQFGLEDEGRLYDVKQEIYRLPDRLLYGLAMYYGIRPESGWNAVEQLASRGIIGQGAGAEKAAHHLQYAVSFATMLRLKTYLHHDQQAERVTMLRRASPEQAQQGLNKLFVLPEEALQERGSLFKYYYTALPLHRKMEAFCEAREGKFSPSKEAGFFQAETFYDASPKTIGDIYRRLLDHEAAKGCYEQALQIAQKIHGPEHPEVAKILNNLGIAWDQLGDPKQAISHHERTLAIDEQAYGPEHPQVATSLNNLGLAWRQLGNPKQAISYYEQALAIEEKAYGRENPRVALSLNNLGAAWNQLGDHKQAIGYYEQALPIYEQAYGPEHPLVATSLNNLGSAWDDLGDPKQALSYYERALSIHEQAYDPEHPKVAKTLNNLGLAWDQLGEHQKAISYYEQALPIYEQAYGPEHPHVATILHNLGSAWNKLGNPKQAIEYFEQALPIAEQAYGREHPDVATSLNNLGRAWNKLGNPKQAISYSERSLAIIEQAYGPEHPDVATSLNNLGLAWDDLGEPKQAIEYFERALAIYEQAYGPEHPHVAASLNNLGGAWNQLGEPKQAIRYYERALAISQQAYGPEHPLVATSLNNLGRAWVQLGKSKEAISYYEQALPIREQAYGPEHPQVATSLNNLGSAWEDLGDPKQAIEYFERALAISQQAYGPEHPQVAVSLNNLGKAWNKLGNPKQAISYSERSLAIIEQAYGPEHPDVATTLNNLGLAWDDLGEPKQAIEYFERALPIFQKAYGPEHPHVATSLSSLGSAWNQLGDPKQALSYHKQALAIREQVYGPEHPDVARSLNNLGSAWGKLGDHKEAKACYERALAIREQAYGPEHPQVATTLNNLGTACNQLGDPKQAIRYYERALPIFQQAYGPDHPDVATTLNNLGLAWDQLGKSKEAKACYERALAIREQVYGPDHPEVATSLSNLGGAWNQLGEPKQAIGYYERALAITEKAYGPENPQVAMSLNNLGEAWRQLGNPKQAIEYFERALAIDEKVYGPEHPDVAISLNNLGTALHQLGDPKQAISYLEQALAIREQAYGPDHPHVATTLNNLGLAWHQLGKSKQAIECFKQALPIYEQAYGPEHPHVATSLSSLGSAWNQLGEPKQALSYHKRALAINEQAYGPEHPKVATDLNNLGLAWNQLGDWKQAISYHKRALASYEQAYGPEHPDVATTLNNLGGAWNELGDPKQAISYYERALAIDEQAYGPEHPHVATSLNNLGGAWNELGDPKQALSYHKQALAIREQVYGPEHPDVARSLNNLGSAWGKLGDHKEAKACYERALAIREQAYGPEHPQVATTLNNLGTACNQLGDHKQAIRYYERALPINEQAYGPEHPHVATSLNNLGSAWYQLGKPKQAISYFERALPINEQAYGPEHPEVATNLNNLGFAWDKLENSKQAIGYYERAYHIMKKAYGEHHPSTQIIKRNMEQLAGRL